jgi:hypothetical protein
MDDATRRVVAGAAGCFGVFMAVIGALLLARGQDTTVGVIYVVLGLLWGGLAVVVARRIARL